MNEYNYNSNITNNYSKLEEDIKTIKEAINDSGAIYILDFEPFEKFDLTFEQHQKCLKFIENYFIEYDSPCSIGDVEDFINKQFYNNKMAFALHDYNYGWYPGDVTYVPEFGIYRIVAPSCL